MPPGPAPANPGRGVSRPGVQPEPGYWEPVITRTDPVPLAEWLAPDLDEEEPPGFGEDDLAAAFPWSLADLIRWRPALVAERS